MNMTCAFFDLDHTLVSTSTGLLWYKYLRKKGHASVFDTLKALYAYFRYRMNSLDIKTLAEREVRKVTGISERTMIEMCERWFHDMVKQHISPRAVEVVNEHRAKGHVLAILSAATPYTVDPVKRHLGIDHGICTHLDVKEGRFTGKLVEPYCYGEGKIYWAERFADESGLSLSDCYFYTDSFTDLPMLERVGMPRPVNPDRLLEAEAHKRGWPIVKF
ncbi:MAG: HAD family hydrolase [Candidatus Abyssobacteria bacterium SURF_17]|uniref:HAD family hydrolase n=1 Tax=Candidatus Abyssobacteria bacterium SURF_17 TaxID=2093361 RepID=A0A419F2W0_9BACT|nr:MAG: HAD family hydrolase [Candidatus Abyssubacteria bacterium SURF_17]